MTVKYGSATYYCDCPGASTCCKRDCGDGTCKTTCTGACCSAGACGDCNNGALQAAYTHLGTGCIYDKNCSVTMCAHSCGDQIYVLNQCPNGTGKYVTIHDCFPLKSSGCNPVVACFTQNPPLVDLTRAAFLAVGGDLASGRIPVEVVC